MSADLAWTADGPRSLRYQDVYFSKSDGLSESRTVFLQGCGLPEAWKTRTRFSVAELGFGTGLNVAALLDLWRRTRPSGARLSIFSVEAELIGRTDAARALAGWRGELGTAIDTLLERWPQRRSGLVRCDLPDFGATLDLYLGEVGDAVRRWSGPADAWFLDGFSPSRNPDMWRPEVLRAMARLSAPGARLASFTVAGAVRRGLLDAGFEVAKRKGFGAKRERLEGRWPGEARREEPLGRALVIGGGIAGAALARAYLRQGLACTVLDRAGPGAGASGNPAALVTPRFDAGFGPAAELHAAAFARAAELYRSETPDAIVAQGALQLGRTAKHAGRFSRLATWNGFAAGELELLPSDRAAEALDEAEDADATALAIGGALVVEPAAVLAAWLDGAPLVRGEVARVEREHGLWSCYDRQGRRLAGAEVLAICLGSEAGALLPELDLRSVRGQAEFTAEPVFTGAAAAWGAYAIPTRGGGALFGASHVRGDAGRDIRAGDTTANLATLAEGRPRLAARIRGLLPGQLQARAAVRAATADHLPLAGVAGENLQVLGGLGGRGFTLAPLLAEHLAALAAGVPSPLPSDLAARLSPMRASRRTT